MKWFWWLCFGLTVFILVLTGSRGAYLSAFVGFLFAAWFLRRYVDFFAVAKYSFIGLTAVIVMAIKRAVERMAWPSVSRPASAPEGRSYNTRYSPPPLRT